MNKITTIQHAIINPDNSIAKVGSSLRPATFKKLIDAEYALDYMKNSQGKDVRLVDVFFKERD